MKRIGYSILLAILVLTLGAGPLPAQAAVDDSLPAAQAEDASAAFVPGQLIVSFAPSRTLGTVASRAAGAAQSIGAKVLETDDQGLTLLDVGEATDVRALAAKVRRMKGVRFAEPNYIYGQVEGAAAPATVAEAAAAALPPKYIVRTVHGATPAETTTAAYPVAGLQAMKSKLGTSLVATYPSDPFLWWNDGWQEVGADIVWNNTTASKNVCLIDSGVDYLHKDLVGKIIKGTDFINDDADPMDDNGQGTHTAGIIVANRNNKEGIAGVSTGKVVAVKALDAQGLGSVYDLNQAIRYCADRSDVSIINVSAAGPITNSLTQVVYYAVTSKGKLVVAGAGDWGTSNKYYPAGYSTGYTFSGGVVAVAASGVGSGDFYNYNCRSDMTNYGDWITLVAPGAHIYSTKPWDKTFFRNRLFNTKQRYDYLTNTTSDTISAAAFVSAAAARAWGYQTSLSNIQVVQRLKGTGFDIFADGACWPTSMTGYKTVNVAAALDRGGVSLTGIDPTTRGPLTGATVSVYSGTTLKGSAVITATSPIDIDTGLVDMEFSEWVDILNLSIEAPNTYTPKISFSGYTASAQNAFVGTAEHSEADGTFHISPGEIIHAGNAYVPPKKANFTVVGVEGQVSPHLAIWLPSDHKYIVSTEVNVPGYGDPDIVPYGSLITHPYARWVMDEFHSETIVIHNRTESPANSAAPWYTGEYVVGITDNHASGAYYYDGENLSVIVWKDGVIKARVNKGAHNCGDGKRWWFALKIVSPATGAPTYTALDTCGVLANAPY
jgi:hypothetical protein